MTKLIDKINMLLKENNIDDVALFSKNKFIHFEKVGMIKSSCVARTLYSGSGLHLQYYSWFLLFNDEGSFKDDIKLHISRIAGKIGAKKSKETLIKCGRPKGIIPWNKGKKVPYAKSWNRGKTKHDNEILMQFSLNRMGKNNPCHKINPARKTELNEQNSIIMKELIKTGKFTPKSENRLYRSGKRIVYNGQTYRSSWELLFHLLYDQFEYETLRISYNINDDTRIYIVDFVDHENKIVCEVKPLKLFETDKNKLKELSIIEWCNINSYTYKRFTEDNILLMKDLIIDAIETLSDYDIELYTLTTNLLKAYLK